MAGIGFELKKLLLRDYKIECEMAMPGYVVAMTGMGDTKESMNLFFEALCMLDEIAEQGKAKIPNICSANKVMPVAKARVEETEYTDYAKSVGRISAEYIWAYPPGVPIIIPGEKVSGEIAEVLLKYEEYGFELRGNKKRKTGKILVIK